MRSGSEGKSGESSEEYVFARPSHPYRTSPSDSATTRPARFPRDHSILSAGIFLWFWSGGRVVFGLASPRWFNAEFGFAMALFVGLSALLVRWGWARR
jgi:hypothetical protein